MKTGPNGLNLIKHFEQCRLVAFKPILTDPWTLGWGRAHGIEAGQACSQEQADAWLAEDVDKAADAINRGVSRPIGQNEFDAVSSLIYNIGETAFWASTLRRKLADGDILGTADEFLRWNKSAGMVLAGLTRRRNAERRLFLTPDGEPFEL